MPGVPEALAPAAEGHHKEAAVEVGLDDALDLARTCSRLRLPRAVSNFAILIALWKSFLCERGQGAEVGLERLVRECARCRLR